MEHRRQELREWMEHYRKLLYNAHGFEEEQMISDILDQLQAEYDSVGDGY